MTGVYIFARQCWHGKNGGKTNPCRCRDEGRPFRGGLYVKFEKAYRAEVLELTGKGMSEDRPGKRLR
jgi:hypothetical protein